MFNTLSYGGNTIPEKLEREYDTEEDVINLILSWFDGAYKALDPLLPEKFYLMSHCGGAYYSSLWALKNPNRVAKLFLSDPGGVVNPPKSFDPFKDRMNDEGIRLAPKHLIEQFYPYGNQFQPKDYNPFKLAADIPKD